MSKIIIAIIVVVALAVVGAGMYLALSSSGNKTPAASPSTQNTANTTTVNGMKIEILKEGSGVEAKTGDTVTVHYVGTLTDGTKFDSSIDRNDPFMFTIGGRVIQGWNEGVVGMKVGEKRKLTIPPAMAYGENGAPPIIPPNATLTFEIEMLKIN